MIAELLSAVLSVFIMWELIDRARTNTPDGFKDYTDTLLHRITDEQMQHYHTHYNNYSINAQDSIVMFDDTFHIGEDTRL